VRVWKARAIEPIKSVKAFLFRVAQNVAVDRIRRSRTMRETAVGNLPGYDVIDENNNVGETISVHEKESFLAAALSTLPARAHDVVILCKLNGLSHREAGEQLGIAERTVDEHLRRGMKRLGAELRKRGLHSLYEV
jgi:RNA polymerase sigma-70 factor (ECF subfamily)